MKKRFLCAAVSLVAAFLAMSTVQAQEAVPNGAALYTIKCAGCHGQDGSKGLQGKSADFVIKALTGYRAKTFGGAKKEIMEGRAAQLTDAEIKALANVIAAF